MKTTLITITVPKNQGEKWKISIGRAARISKSNANSAFSALARFCAPGSRLTLPSSYAIRVVYPDGTTNETMDSIDPTYLLFATTCFLEDYLSSYMQKNEKKYREAMIERQKAGWIL